MTIGESVELSPLAQAGIAAFKDVIPEVDPVPKGMTRSTCWSISLSLISPATGYAAYNELHLRIRCPSHIHNLGISSNDLARRMTPENVVGAQHEHDDIGRRLLHPSGDVAVGDIDGQPTGMSLMMLIPVGCLGLAVLGVAVLGTDVLDLAGVIGGGNLVPYQGAPAGYLGNAVSKGHFLVVSEGSKEVVEVGHVLMRSLDV